MEKRLLVVVDIFSILAIAVFFSLAARREAFPRDVYDRTISFIQLGMLFPFVFGILWLIYRLLWKKRSLSFSCGKRLAIASAPDTKVRRIIIPIILAAVIVFIIKFSAFLIKVI
jgi:hypothetical protein